MGWPDVTAYVCPGAGGFPSLFPALVSAPTAYQRRLSRCDELTRQKSNWKKKNQVDCCWLRAESAPGAAATGSGVGELLGCSALKSGADPGPWVLCPSHPVAQRPVHKLLVHVSFSNPRGKESEGEAPCCRCLRLLFGLVFLTALYVFYCQLPVERQI